MTPRASGICFHCGCTRKEPCIFGHYRAGVAKCRLVQMNPRLVCSNRECAEKEIELVWAEVEGKQRRAVEALCG
jgi:hypothetical protein